MISKKVTEEITGFPSVVNPINIPINDSLLTDLLSTARLKKRCEN
jgi:hypothetical protein